MSIKAGNKIYTLKDTTPIITNISQEQCQDRTISHTHTHTRARAQARAFQKVKTAEVKYSDQIDLKEMGFQILFEGRKTLSLSK